MRCVESDWLERKIAIALNFLELFPDSISEYEKARFAFIARYIEERTYKSIGVDLGVGPHGARHHVRKGLRLLTRRRDMFVEFFNEKRVWYFEDNYENDSM